VDSDLELMRGLPGVVEATYSSGAPLSGSGSANHFSVGPTEDDDGTPANYYYMDHRGIETLGVELAAGRSFRPEDVVRITDPEVFERPKVAIATRAFLKKLFPDDVEYVGKVFYSGDDPVEVVGVIEKMQGAWVSWDNFEQVVVFPLIEPGPLAGYLVRTEPGKANALLAEIEDKLGQSDTTRLINHAATLRENADRSYSRDRGMAVALGIVIALLVTVTALGIVGLAAFNVRTRTKQIGTRRAIGARRGDILRYFLAENWLMTTGGVVLGVVLTFVLNYYLATEYSLDKLDPVYVPAGILAMWGLGLLAVLGPARRASVISPAVATRTV
ncbi:MAG: FtsX-like permease family protein, partial [Pseudomonadota bacterium]